jgi:nucleoside-diphosphate-sugar epimerase
MPVLVTGAAGFLGSCLTDVLLEQGESVRILVRPGERVREELASRVDVHVGDLLDAGSLKQAVNGADRVLNCAARTGAWGAEAEYDSVNVRGLRSLVEIALDAGVRRIVHVSSVTVHGVDVRGTADETARLRGGPDPYSRSKVAGERLLQQMIQGQGAPVSIVRPGLIYGPRDTNSFGRFAELIERGRMVVVGSGTNHLPLIYVTDVARGIILASESAPALGRAYVLVGDEPVRQCDYLNAIADALGVAHPSRHIPYRLALGLGAAAEVAGHLARRRGPPRLTRFGLQVLGGENRFSISNAHCDLGFSPQISLAEGVQRGIAWYRTIRPAPSA